MEHVSLAEQMISFIHDWNPKKARQQIEKINSFLSGQDLSFDK